MKISLVCTNVHESSTFLRYMLIVLKNSLQDLGYYNEDIETSDVVIAIQAFPEGFLKKEGVKYIWLQTENKDFASHVIRRLIKLGPDKLDARWGFDITHTGEIYTPIGYHPSVDFTLRCKTQPNYKYDIGLIGVMSPLRTQFQNKLGLHINQFETFDPQLKFECCYNTKVNLDFRSQFTHTLFTCWDRLSFLIANKCFVLSENCYFPNDLLNQFGAGNIDECRDKLKYCIANDTFRKGNIEDLYDWYRTEMQMNVILEDRLKLLK